MLTLLACKNSLRLSIARDVERKCCYLPVQQIVCRDALAHERPLVAKCISQLALVTVLQVDIELFLECESGERSEDDHDSHVHYVAAVTTAIACDEAHESRHQSLAVHLHACAGSLVKLLHHCHRHKGCERIRDDRCEVAHSEQHQNERRRYRGYDRTKKLPLKICDRRATPRDERPDSSQQQQRESQRNIDRVEERRTDRDLLAANRFGNDRE